MAEREGFEWQKPYPFTEYDGLVPSGIGFSHKKKIRKYYFLLTTYNLDKI